MKTIFKLLILASFVGAFFQSITEGLYGPAIVIILPITLFIIYKFYGINIFKIIKDNVFGISKTAKRKLITKIPDEVLTKEFDAMINSFISGENASSFTSTVLLKKNEKLIFDIPDIQLCEERSIKMKGGYQGFSVRVVKGVYYRFGSFSGGTEQQVVAIDNGNLTLTNKRLIFSGEKKSMDCNIQKINSITPCDNGFALNRSGKQKTEYYTGTNNVTMNLIVSPDLEKGDTWKEDTFKYELSGEEIRLMVQKILQQDQ